MKKVLLMLAAMGIFSCTPNQETATATEEGSTAEVTQNAFGVEVNQASAINLSTLMSLVADKDSVADVTVEGKVVEVCQKAGCWMTLEKPDGSTIRVKFKDYALFMPKDISGKEVVIHGVARKETTTVADLKHYAEDAGKSEEEIAAITESETKVNFEADGVLIRN